MHRPRIAGSPPERSERRAEVRPRPAPTERPPAATGAPPARARAPRSAGRPRAFALTAALLSLGAAGCDGAAAADAGLGDAGALDGAPDAGAPDGGNPDGGAPDASIADASLPDAGPPAPPPPRSVFFVGNSFTFGGPVPRLVEDLAIYAGFEPPNVEYRALGGATLEGHRADDAPDGAPARVAEGWDAVVLQENSVRPTDQVGPAERFKEDATWFHDLALDARPDCEVVLYETWARRWNHPIYPDVFEGPAQMQAELRFHYDDAADRHIPTFSRHAPDTSARVARVGDAWEAQLAGGEPPRLHAADDYHAGRNGQYLSALVIYGTLFRRRADGLVPLNGVDEDTAGRLQGTADEVTGASGFGAVLPPFAPVASGDAVRVDLGPRWVVGWSPLHETTGTIVDLTTAGGAASTARVTAWGFSGTQEGGSPDNGLGLPGDVSRDTLWLGSFDGHAAALDREARLVVRGLPEGRYRVELFASRTGTDGGRGRLTRYRIGPDAVDLEVANNTADVAVFDDVRPDPRGEIVVRVGVSPDGSARFAYAGALRVTRR
ncbi:MAG TPA: hypothetical protein RMH99_30010 [Sandaracinaceae bacterium LLY-WYZ-13_1]|nr:hypothetical protein [Sandaracinaceae bacterium LLY-WYZ-13_1]